MTNAQVNPRPPLDTLDEASERTPDRIEREIDAERGKIKSTLGALEDKMSVGALIDRLSDAVGQDGGSVVKNVSRSVRANPLPMALIGLGIAWLALNSGDDHEDGIYDEDGDGAGEPLYYASPRPASYARGHAPSTGNGAAAGTVEGNDASDTTGPGRLAAMREQAERAGSSARNTADASAARAGAAVDQVRHRTRRAKNHAGRRAQQVGRQASSFMEDNPMAAGALAFAAGAALGALTPNTGAEDRLMGDRASALREDALDRVRDGMDRGRRAAGAAADAAADEVANRVDEAEQRDGATKAEAARDKVEASAERVKDAAREEANRPGTA